MKKQFLIIGIIVLLVSAGLTLFMYNPFNIEKNKFIGTWKKGAETMDLSSNGACTINTSQGKWHGKWVLKDSFFITVINGELGLLTTGYYYEFANNDRTLTLTPTFEGDPEVYTKQ